MMARLSEMDSKKERLRVSGVLSKISGGPNESGLLQMQNARLFNFDVLVVDTAASRHDMSDKNRLLM